MEDAEIHFVDLVPEWYVIREDINAWIWERRPDSCWNGSQFLRDMEDECPGQTWLEIADWIVGFTTPNVFQQRLLWQWVLSRRSPEPHSRSRGTTHTYSIL